MNIVETSVLRC